jgi:uncharacterized protein YndB with AHSA1/START domain
MTHMTQWMCPGDILSAEVRLEPRVGGSLYILMRGPNKNYEHNGEFKVVERPSRLAFTWTGPHLDDKVTLVTVEFIPLSGTETELVLKHQYIPKTEERDNYYQGWRSILELLAKHLGRE